jgi:hypothetical protein
VSGFGVITRLFTVYGVVEISGFSSLIGFFFIVVFEFFLFVVTEFVFIFIFPFAVGSSSSKGGGFFSITGFIGVVRVVVDTERVSGFSRFAFKFILDFVEGFLVFKTEFFEFIFSVSGSEVGLELGENGGIEQSGDVAEFVGFNENSEFGHNVHLLEHF